MVLSSHVPSLSTLLQGQAGPDSHDDYGKVVRAEFKHASNTPLGSARKRGLVTQKHLYDFIVTPTVEIHLTVPHVFGPLLKLLPKHTMMNSIADARGGHREIQTVTKVDWRIVLSEVIISGELPIQRFVFGVVFKRIFDVLFTNGPINNCMKHIRADPKFNTFRVNRGLRDPDGDTLNTGRLAFYGVLGVAIGKVIVSGEPDRSTTTGTATGKNKPIFINLLFLGFEAQKLDGTGGIMNGGG